MYRTSRIISIISGIIILIFGILSFTAAWGEFAFFDTITTTLIYALCGLLFTASGICGIVGGVLLAKKTRTGRALLLAAGITSLAFFPMTGLFYGLAFFMLFMTARNRAVPQWPEDDLTQSNKESSHD